MYYNYNRIESLTDFGKAGVISNTRVGKVQNQFISKTKKNK